MGVILVTGATGTLGRVVARKLLTPEREVRVLSRRTAAADTPYAWHTGDLRTGAGIADAVRGAETIIHCASGLRDLEVTRNLLEAEARENKDSPAHLVYISIVGVDRIPFFYYNAKLAAESVIETSGRPYTILRATQFHDLIARLVDSQKRLPVVFMPSGRVQPVDVRDVADRLIDLALGDPAGRAPDFGGPEIRTARDLARACDIARGRSRRVVSVPVPGPAGRGVRAGANLVPEIFGVEGKAVGKIIFEEYLADR